MKKYYLLLLLPILIAVFIICTSQHNNKADNWTHETFQGTVTNISTEQEHTIFSMTLSGSGVEKKFIMDSNTIYAISFQVGDQILVESDYNTREHNGGDSPYPAIMIADPAVTDKAK